MHLYPGEVAHNGEMSMYLHFSLFLFSVYFYFAHLFAIANDYTYCVSIFKPWACCIFYEPDEAITLVSGIKYHHNTNASFYRVLLMQMGQHRFLYTTKKN